VTTLRGAEPRGLVSIGRAQTTLVNVVGLAAEEPLRHVACAQGKNAPVTSPPNCREPVVVLDELVGGKQIVETVRGVMWRADWMI